MRRLLTVTFALATLASAGCRDIAAARFRKHVTDKPAPDFELTALDGAKVRLSSFRGQPVLLAFWAYG